MSLSVKFKGFTKHFEASGAQWHFWGYPGEAPGGPPVSYFTILWTSPVVSGIVFYDTLCIPDRLRHRILRYFMRPGVLPGGAQSAPPFEMAQSGL